MMKTERCCRVSDGENDGGDVTSFVSKRNNVILLFVVIAQQGYDDIDDD